ncbi:MAG: Ig-like domain-containing protein [Deltaproteobacteria bacterium]|nr:Ig-like domain-containing protein [Deltaproteobacteria bacterium]
MRSSHGSSVLLVVVALAACEVVTPNNPFDPGTPPDQQAPATLRGTVVLDDPTASTAALATELQTVAVKLKDEAGDVVNGPDGNPLILPLGVDGTFGIELPPGVVRLDIAVGDRFTDRPTLAPINLRAGVVVDVGRLVFVFRPSAENPGPGTIDGQVRLEGGSGGERSVQLFRLDPAQRQALVATTTTDAAGAFSFEGLSVGTYALAATLEDFTPDYRTEIALADNDDERARTFAGGEALTLHPVTAVLLPQLPLIDGSFYTRDDVVTVAVLSVGAVTGMRLIAVPCTQAAPGCASAQFGDTDPFVQPAASAEPTLPDVEGRIGVFVQFESRSAFVFTSPVFNTTIVRDTTAPEVRSLARLGEGPALEIVATGDTVNIVADADDAGGVAAVGLVVQPAGDPAPSAELVPLDVVSTPPGPASLTRTVPLPNVDGVFDVWFVVRDRAGNLSLPSSLRVRKDTAPAAAVPLVVDAVEPLDGRAVAVHLHFDATGVTALPVSVQLGVGSLPADTNSGREDFDALAEYIVTANAVDGETLGVQARLFDEVGNVTTVTTTTFVTLRGTVSGVVDLEQLGAVRVLDGTTVRALAGDGSVLATTTTDSTGAYALNGVREGRVTLSALRTGHRGFTQELAFVEANDVVSVDALLPLQRGALVGRFRRADLDATDGRHSGISVTVRLVSQTRSALARPALTGADGDWSLDLVPATVFGETLEVVANADGYGQGLVQDVVVGDNALTVVSPDVSDPQTPTSILLPVISGDFDLCSAVAAGGDCAPLEFTNANRVRVHLRSDTGVTRIRAAVDALPDETALPLEAYDEDVDVVVDLPDVQGRIAVFVDLERDGGRQVLGPVQIFRDTVRPAAPDLVVARGAKARREGFTNEGFVRATITFNEGDVDVTRASPLGRAPTFFADTAPTEPSSTGLALCVESSACTVLLPALAGVIDEDRHDLFAFACDAAGNCSAAPGAASIVYDETPPSALHGVSFAPLNDSIVDQGNGEFLTASGAYAVDVDVGTATNSAGSPVLDPEGLPVRDVDALALSLVAAIDDDDAEDVVSGDVPGGVATVSGIPLLGGEGDYDVFALFVDAAGNATAVEPNPFTFTLTLDTTPPTARLVLADDATITNSRTIAARLEDTSELGSVKLTSNAAACNDDDGYVSFASAPATHLLDDVDGTHIVLACLKDVVGNVSFATDTIALDRAAPSGSVVLDGGAAFSGDRSLVAAFEDVSVDVVRLKVALRRSTAPALSCSDGTYVAFTNSAALSIGALEPAGSFVADVCFEDAAGNRSALPASDDLLFDGDEPTATIVLNSGDAFTTNAAVSASITFTNGLGTAPTAMRFSSTTSFSGPTEAFASTKAGITLGAPTVEGSKDVCVEVTDELGRVATAACDSIALDLVAPIGTLTTSSFQIAAPFNVTLRSADLNIATAAVGEGIDCGTATFTTLAINTDSTRAVLLADTTTEGSRTLAACFKDTAGQVSRVERTITFDPTDPPLATGGAPVDGVVTSNRRPVFAWAAVPGAVRFNLIVRTVSTEVTALNQANITGLSFAPTSNLPEGQLEWIVVATKASGRTSAQVFTGAPKVTIDATAPSPATAIVVAVDAGRALITTPAPCSATNPCVSDNTPRLSFTIGSDVLDPALTHTVQIANKTDAAFAAPVFTTVRTDGVAFDVNQPLEDGAYAIRVRSTDDAGNTATSATADFTVDRVAPDVPAFLPVKDPVSSSLAGDIALGWTAEGPSGAVGYRFQFTTEARTFANPIVNDSIAGVTNTVVSVKTALQAGGHVVHQARVASVDALGNQSAFAVIAFANDTTAPCGAQQSLTILGLDAANAFSDSAAVVVEVVCGSDPADPFDGPSRMQVGCDGTAAGKPFTGFSGFATCVLPGADGTKSVQAVVVDLAGNSTTAFADTIIVDRRDPTTPVLSIDDVITNNPIFSFQIEEGSTDVNFLRHEFIDGVEVTSFDDPRAIIAGTTVNLALIDERVYNVRVRGIDNAGNASAEAIARVTLDVTDPTQPEIAGNDAPVAVNANAFTFFLEVPAADLHFATYELSTDAGPFAPTAGDGTFTVSLPQDRTTTFAVRAVDDAGNVGLPDSITVIEDSRNPRPVELAPLPRFTNGGTPQAFNTPSFRSRGSYVDVHFERADFNISGTGVDDNFDHFEIRATADAFVNFVPLCLVATPSCPLTVRTDLAGDVVGADHIIRLDDTIVGFRIPLVRARENTIILRSVDKAGNISVETSVSTTEVSVVRATNDDRDELVPSLFGDRLVWIDRQTGFAKLREPGADNLFGSDDDDVTDLRVAAQVPSDVFSPSEQLLAQGPGFICQTFNNTNIIVMCHGPGADQRFSTPGDNTQSNANDDPSVVGDELVDATEPTMWRDRIAWRSAVNVNDSDIRVREGGPDGTLFTADDRFAVVANDNVHQKFPQLSGENLSFFRCASPNCDVAGDPVVVVVNSGGDRLLGSADDIVRVLPQVTGIDASLRPQLYTPGTPGRAACRNVFAYGGEGVFVIAAGPDGLFDADDPPVQVMATKGLLGGGVRSFNLYDDVVIANDGFAPPFLEVVTGGRDGCLTRTSDNVAFDSGLESFGSQHALHDHRIVTHLFSPTSDLAILELGAERTLWPRDERTAFVPNVDADVDGVAFAGGGFFDLAARQVQTPFNPGQTEDVESSRGAMLHGPAGGFIFGGPPTFGALTATERGDDGVYGTGDDRSVDVSATRPLALDNNVIQSNSSSFSLDGRIAVWGGRSASALVVPVLHFAGADGAFGIGGDDCEVELAGPEQGYQFVRSSLRRQVFQSCSAPGCTSVGPILAREVDGDVCAGSSSVRELAPAGGAPDVDGPRAIYLFNGLRVVDGGADGRLTTLGDNTDRLFSRTNTVVSQAPRISGDRAVWVDARSETNRVVIGDLADGSERVLSRSATGNNTVSIEGDLVVWGAEVSGLTNDIVAAYIGLQPDLPADARNAVPTRLRCPDDDAFEENDSTLTATPMNSGAAVNAIACRNDDDRFSVDVPAIGCVVRARAHFLHADGNLDMQLFDPTDALVGQATSSTNDELISISAGKVGLHTLRVFGVAGAENAYDVGVTVSCP